jgi:hypothetical protein
MRPANTRLLSVICALALPILGWAAEIPTAEQVDRLARELAFSEYPDLRTYVHVPADFRVRNLEIKGLWEEMNVQLFGIEALGESALLGIYHNGEMTSLGPDIGGSGLMSGLIQNGEFYCTYSWGSGIHRSHVVKLRVEKGRLRRWDSGGYVGNDVFVSRGLDDKVQIFTGEFKEFNHWEAGTNIGFVVTTNSSEIQIVGPEGNVVVPHLSYPSEKRQQGGATNGSQQIRSETNRTSSAAGRHE